MMTTTTNARPDSDYFERIEFFTNDAPGVDLLELYLFRTESGEYFIDRHTRFNDSTITITAEAAKDFCYLCDNDPNELLCIFQDA